MDAFIAIAQGVEIKGDGSNSDHKGQWQEYTYISYKQDLEHVLKFIDRTMPLSRLMRNDFQRIVHHWLAQPNDISIRTAVNYCKTFKQMIDWLADLEEVEFVKPRGTDRLFRFKGFNPIRVEPYTNEQLKKLFAVLPERYRFYVQLALNCGYYQSDIATLRYDHLYTFEGGTEVPVRNLTAFDGDLFIKRRRQKTLHQNDFETLCYLWPENVELLRKLGAQTSDAWDGCHRQPVGIFQTALFVCSVTHNASLHGVRRHSV